MSRNRRISYQWRLFFPLVITLWVLLLGMAGWQYLRERKYRRQFVAEQLAFINERIVETINSGDRINLTAFLDFIGEYYERNVLFDDVRVSVYDKSWNCVDTVGLRIVLDPDERKRVERELIERRVDKDGTRNVGELGNQEYFYMGKTTNNGMTVIAALPKSERLSNYLAGDTLEVWIIVFSLVLGMTVICYFSTRYLGRNIRILRNLAERSANDPWFTPGTDYPHDELGDIARKIVQMYNERAIARKRTEREHRMALHSIEEKARQKRQLTNNINHELKTPIGIIKGYLDTIVDTPDLDEDTRMHFIHKALTHTNRLVELVADVSAITRLEEGANQMATEYIDYHELVYVFVNDMREAGILGHFEIDYDVPLGMFIRGNHNLLVGMLLNMTKNAVSYSQGSKLRIEYRGENDEFYKFAYYDDGTGIPEESIEHIFDRFYRIDMGRTRKSGGTGLGLAIVYNTIKAHGGEIICRNRAEGGLEFEFTLPKVEENEVINKKKDKPDQES